MDKISGKFFDAPKGAQYAKTRFCIPQPNGITECEVMFYKKEVNKEDNTTQWRRYETDSGKAHQNNAGLQLCPENRIQRFPQIQIRHGS